MRAATYCRVSTAEQAQHGTSIDDQRTRTKSYIEAKGWTLVEEYVDEGVSGSLARRPALDRLMAAARNGDIDVIVTTKLDRFGRSVSHLSSVIPHLEDLGVAFVSIVESLDGTTATGRLMRNILASFAEFEREQITERMVTGQQNVARAGGSAGGPPPFGYRVVKGDRMSRLAIDDDEAEVVRTAVELVLDHGLSTWETADRLNALGLTPRKSASWSPTNVLRLLRTETIAGRWHRGEIGIEIPLIITPERFESLQIALRATATGPKRPERYYLLSGLTTAVCGGRLTGLWRKDRQRRYYRCSESTPDRRKGSGPCGCRSILADDIEFVVKEALTDLLSRPEYLMRIASDFIAERAEQMGPQRDQLATIDDKVAAMESAITDQAAALLKEGMDAKRVQAITSKLEDELAALYRHRRQLEAWQTEGRAKVDRATELAGLAEVANTRLGELSDQEWRQVLELLDVEIRVTEGPTRSAPARIALSGTIPEMLSGRGEVADGELQHPFAEVTVSEPIPFWLQIEVA